MNIRINEDNNINRAKSSDSNPYNVQMHNSMLPENKGIEAAFFSKTNDNSIVIGGNDKGKTLEDIMSMAGNVDTTVMKDTMTVLSQSVSDESYKDMMDSGYDINEMDSREIVTVADRIKTEVAKGGEIVEGYNDDIEDESIVKAAKMAEALAPLTDGAIRYMTDNGMQPTIENLYYAEHIGANDSRVNASFYKEGAYLSRLSKEYTISDVQLEAILRDNGEAPTKENIDTAKKMIELGIEVDNKSLELFKKLSHIELPPKKEVIDRTIKNALIDGISCMEGDITKELPLIKEAINLCNAVENISEEAIDIALSKKLPFTINNLSRASRDITEAVKELGLNVPSSENVQHMENSQKADSRGDASKLTNGKELLASIRMSMTVSSTFVLLKNKIDVGNESFNLLVDELKQAENYEFESVFGKEYFVDMNALKSYEETNDRIRSLKNMPIDVIGTISGRNAYSINVIYEEGITVRNKYASLNQKYEPLMTEVRKDLGDSIEKAFANVDDILKELGIEANDETRRAVRILGYNSMDITSSSIESVIKEYNRVHDVISRMTPKRTMTLIRQGVNPLEVPLNELGDKLNDIAGISPVEEAERYSHYLCRLEDMGEISDAEKESFVGIYKMIHSIEKNDSASIGLLMSTGAEINFKNLLSAVRTRKKNIDTKVNDDFGMTDLVMRGGKSIDEMIEEAYLKIGQGNLPKDMYQEEQISNVKAATKMWPQVSELFLQSDLRPSVNNITGANELLKNRGTIIKKLRELSDKSTNVDNNVDNLIEEESVFDEIVNNCTDNFDNMENSQKAYNDMIVRIENVLSEEMLETGNRVDVKDISLCLKTVGVMKSLAKEEHYEIPVRINGEDTSIALKVIHSKETAGNVKVYMETEEYGQLGASITYSDGIISNFFSAESANGLEYLKSVSGRYFDRLGDDYELGDTNYVVLKVNGLNSIVGKTDNNSRGVASNGIEADSKSKDAISSKALYTIAKAWIKAVSDREQ